MSGMGIWLGEKATGSFGSEYAMLVLVRSFVRIPSPDRPDGRRVSMLNIVFFRSSLSFTFRLRLSFCVHWCGVHVHETTRMRNDDY